MLKIFDFMCNDCETPFESLAETDEVPPCPECGSKNTVKTVLRSFPKAFEVIRATTYTSAPYTAGGIHKAKRPAEKIQVSVPRTLP